MTPFPTTSIPVRSSTDPTILYTVTVGPGAGDTDLTVECTCPSREHPCKHGRRILRELAEALVGVPELEHYRQALNASAADGFPAHRETAGQPRTPTYTVGMLRPEDLREPPTPDEWAAAAGDPQAEAALRWRETEYAKRHPELDRQAVVDRVALALGKHGVAVREDLAELAVEAGLEVIPPTASDWTAWDRRTEDAERALSLSADPDTPSDVAAARDAEALDTYATGRELLARAQACREGAGADRLEVIRQEFDTREAHRLEAARRRQETAR
jgi:hypothetical protein